VGQSLYHAPGNRFDDLRWRRDVQRATVRDAANSCEQEGIEIAAA